MTADREENYEELVAEYEELVDKSYEKFQDFSGYIIEAQNTLEQDKNIHYLRNTLAASAAAAPEVIEAKEDLDNMVQQLEIEKIDSMEDFIETVLIRSEDQKYSFEYQSQFAMMEALVRNQEKLMQMDEQYHRGTSLETDLGNITFKIAF